MLTSNKIGINFITSPNLRRRFHVKTHNVKQRKNTRKINQVHFTAIWFYAAVTARMTLFHSVYSEQRDETTL